MSNYFLPRLKPLVEYYPTDDKVYFFSRPGVAIEMSASPKFIDAVCKLMDGKKNIHLLKEILTPLFPEETPYLDNLLAALDNEYLLEDIQSNISNALSNYDINRWSRNIEFFGAHNKANDNKYSYQEKLMSTKVAIFGLGGVGSNILYNLAAMGVHNITAIDFDKVELSNLNRQIIYDESDIGRQKSLSAKDRISKFLPNANIKFINKKITSSNDIEEFILNHDIVISAIDHPREEIMEWFNIACVKHGIPYICGSLDSIQATCYTIFPGITGCIECWKMKASEKSLVFQNLIRQKDFVSASSPNVAIMPLISIVAGLVGNEFLKIITGISEPQTLGQLCTFDFATYQTKISEKWERNHDCSVCRTS